jgi:hypothetical protein
MRFIIFLSCVALAIASPTFYKLIKLSANIPWEWCGDGRPAEIPELTVEPYPVVVAHGAKITLAVTIELLETIPVGTRVKLHIVKENWLINIPIPCIPINGNHVGSCEYDGDYLLEKGAGALCGDELTPGGYFPPGQECKFPLAPGTYGGKDPLVITLPDEIPDTIINLLASGKFIVDMTFKREDGSEISCAKIHLEVTGS